MLQILISLSISIFALPVLANVQNDLCSTGDPINALASKTNIESFVEKFSEARDIMNAQPLQDKKEVKKGLDLLLNDYLAQQAGLNEIGPAAHKTPPETKILIDALINGYLNDLQYEYDKIDLLAAELPPKVQGKARLEQRKWIKDQLVTLYQERMVLLVSDLEILTETEKFALTDWVFQLLPEGPRFKTNTSSEKFLKYMEDISHQHNMMTWGRVPNGVFTVSPVYTQQAPGLVAAITFKPSEWSEGTYINVQLNESPFLNKMELSLCQFSGSRGGCTPIEISQWCSN